MAPHIEAGDKDARYLSLLFCTTKTAQEFETRRKQHLKELGAEQHISALLDLAWMHRHGDDGHDQSDLKFLQLMTAAALMGDNDALKHVKTYIAARMEWEQFPLPPADQAKRRAAKATIKG
ncbi:hypothetical protein [Pseudophaeobacter sp.]|uniref:hypothetical protein n=1 Tax=Pseudophaeobacter sp. TaxID=1971739 RepID=UPI00329738CA